MTDSTPTTTRQELATNDQQTAPAPARAREYRVVESRLGIMDTARFEHLGRVATVLARAGLLPESLTHTGPSNNRLPLEWEVIQARAFLIANQADLLEIDPNALAQCTSFVHGRLMYEGKLVHALISAKLGLDLDYQFGTYDLAKRDIRGEYVKDQEAGTTVWKGEMPTKPDDPSLGVRVVGKLPGETAPRWIAGSVGMWHKGDKSPWGSVAAWPRQLRYMGAREWARAYKPSLMLGILADDEVDEYDLGRQVGQIAPAAPQLLSSGFSDTRAATLQQESKPKRRGKDAATGDDKGAPAAEAAKTEPTATQEAAAASEEGLPEALQGLGDGEPEAQTADEPDATADQVAEGYPAADEVYHLTGDSWGDDGRRDTYKNGVPFSRAKPSAGHSIYEDHHAPEGPGGVATDEAVTDTAAKGEAEDDGFPPEFSTYIHEVENAKSWVEVKKAMQTFYTTELFKNMVGAQQNQVRANTWDTCVEANISDLPDPTTDASAFRLWTEASTDPDAILNTLSTLEASPAFASKDENFRGVIRGAAEKRVAALRE